MDALPFALTALALASCSSPTQRTPAGDARAPTLPLPADSAALSRGMPEASAATFTAVESKAVLATAMVYPKAQLAAPEPPLSLTASDGTGLELVSLEGRAVIDGPLGFTELRLRFRNPEDRVLEGRFRITLPDGATVSRLAMRLDKGWQEAEVVERQAARRAYEDFLHRRQDPALLEKEAGNEFSARIFPIPPRGDKDIILSYSQPLVGTQARYRLPLQGLPRIEHLNVVVQVGSEARAGKTMGYQVTKVEQRGQAPTSDVDVPVPSEITGMAADELVAVRVRPELGARRVPMDRVAILFDTSASRAPGFAAQVARLGALIDELEGLYGSQALLALAAFDQGVAPIYQGLAGNFGAAELEALRARRPLGASNLYAGLAWAASAGARRVIVISDGIATMGPVRGDELRAAVQAMTGKVDRLDVILTGGIRDRDMAGRLVRGLLPDDGVVLDGDQEPALLARRLSLSTVSGIKVEVAGAEWQWPRTLDGVQPGDEALVMARLEGRAPASVRVSFSGATSSAVTVPLVTVARPLIERAAVAARIAELEHARDALAATADKERKDMEREIVALSTRYRVLSDLTALLVLETEDDYQRFGIDRRALADILTVGPRGVEVVHRAAPVLIIADEPEPEKTANKDKGDVAKKSRARNGDDGGDDGDDGADMAPEAKPAPEAPGDMRTDEGRMGKKEEVGVEGDMEEDADEAEKIAAEPAAAPRPEPVASRPPAARESSRASEPREEAPAEAPDSTEAEAASSAEMAGSGGGSNDIPSGPPPYSGRMAEIMERIGRGDTEKALVEALSWQTEEPGDVMALIALGEALEARGARALAARAYGSLIDLFPSRADLRRFAGERLERLGELGAALAADSYAKAVEQRPDHLTGHRLLAYALLRQGAYAEAFAVLERGLAQRYPEDRFRGGDRILREDLGLVAAAWVRVKPDARAQVMERLRAAGAELATRPSLRFVLYWETDANDVDFHIFDGKGGHAFYSQKALPSGGELYEDVTTGYGPECFTIDGVPRAYPYRLQIHYYSRGPMGYGMGKLEVVEHDGAGTLRFDQRPFVVMNDSAYVDLGAVAPSAAMAR